MSHRLPAALLAATLLLVVGCADGRTDPQPSRPIDTAASFPLTITDDDGIAVTLDEPAQRIVTFGPSLTEILFAIGVGDRVVGVSGPYDDHPQAATSIAEVGGAGEFGVDPNLETVVALEPDLFLTISGGDAWKGRLRDLGITVVTLDAADLDDLLGDIAEIGALTGADAAAAELVDRMRADADAVERAVSDSPRVRCFFEVYYPPLIAAGPGTFVDDLLDRAGCDSVSSGAASSYPEWSVEDLIRTAPEVYLVSTESTDDPASVGDRPGYSALDAVVGGSVALVDATLVTRAGPRIVEGLRLLAEALHPGLDL